MMADLVVDGDSEGVKDLMIAIDRYYKNVIKLDIDKINSEISELKVKISTVKEEMSTVKEDVTTVKEEVAAVKFDTSNMKEDIDSIISTNKDITEKLVMNQLDQSVHDRKRSIEVIGIPGNRNERERITREKILDLNFNVFSNSYTPIITACHRLSPEPNSTIILVFSDLDDKSYWLDHAHLLRKYNVDNNMKIFLQQNLPPVLKCINYNLNWKRKSLPVEDRKKCVIKNIKQWPYQMLKFSNGKDPIYPDITKDSIIKKVLEK